MKKAPICISLAYKPSGFYTPSKQKLVEYTNLDTPCEIKTTPGWDISVPVQMSTSSRGTLREIRRKTVGDSLANQLAQKPQPTMRAIRMANAIMLEKLLGTGQYKSPAALAAKIGVNRSLLSELLALLNQPPEDIERQLFETK